MDLKFAHEGNVTWLSGIQKTERGNPWHSVQCFYNFVICLGDAKARATRYRLQSSPGEAHDSDAIGLSQVVDSSGPMGQANTAWIFLSRQFRIDSELTLKRGPRE